MTDSLALTGAGIDTNRQPVVYMQDCHICQAEGFVAQTGVRITVRYRRLLGVFSAFIVALFTEMYGFPLTSYLLSGWVQSRYAAVDWLSHDAGHLPETLLGWRANLHVGPYHLLSVALIGGGFTLIVNGWRVLHAAQRARTLAMFPVLVWVYRRLARPEERETEAHFGDAWRRNAAAVPAFVPSIVPRAVSVGPDYGVRIVRDDQ
ncbi:MAG: hypothetical protein KF709_03865 [Gemmatimonadaceae bacterium]|nr:hypothetical protein [Gemmatimonadaceae bacterium]